MFSKLFIILQADPNNTGSVGALDAANFMKKSGLQDKVLSQVLRVYETYSETPSYYVMSSYLLHKRVRTDVKLLKSIYSKLQKI